MCEPELLSPGDRPSFWCESQDHEATGSRGRVKELQREPRAVLREQLLAVSQDDRVDQQLVVVHQAVGGECVYEHGAPHDQDRAAGQLAQLGDLAWNIPDDLRSSPLRMSERRGRNVFRAGVQRCRDPVAVVRDGRPVAGPDLVGSAPEEEPARGVELIAQVAGVLVHQRCGPAAVLESAVAILAGVPRSLHHTVEGDVLDYVDPAHRDRPAPVRPVGESARNDATTGATRPACAMWLAPSMLRRVALGRIAATASDARWSHAGLLAPSATSTGSLTAAQRSVGSDLPAWVPSMIV